MMRRMLIACALLACVATSAFASGINLAWNDCGASGSLNHTFACNTNSGSHNLYVSFVPAPGTTALVSEEIALDFASSTTPLPPWWMFKNAGTCRQTAVSVTADFTAGPAGCNDYWAGQAIGGMTSYSSSVFAPYTGRSRMIAMFSGSESVAHPAEENIEYGALRISINNTKTVGTGSCGGCSTPMCLVLQRVHLTQPAGVGDYDLYAPLNSNTVTWQGGDLATVCYAATPVRNRTWGGVKSLYR